MTAADGTGPLRLRVQDESQGLPANVQRELLARADSGASGGPPSAAERVARTLGARLLVVSDDPTTLDLVLPAG